MTSEGRNETFHGQSIKCLLWGGGKEGRGWRPVLCCCYFFVGGFFIWFGVRLICEAFVPLLCFAWLFDCLLVLVHCGRPQFD